jgi:hypothetical protein
VHYATEALCLVAVVLSLQSQGDGDRERKLSDNRSTYGSLIGRQMI